MVYHREHTVPRGWRQNSSFSSLSHKSFAFTKISVEGKLLRVNCIFGAYAHSRGYNGCQKQREFDCLPTSSGRMRSWSFSVFAAFAVPVSSLHIYLASLERQSFLVCDGIQTLALVMRWSFFCICCSCVAPSYLFS